MTYAFKRCVWERSKMVVALEDAEPTPSHEQTQIDAYIMSNYSCMTTEGWMDSFWTMSKERWIGKTGKPQEPSGSWGNCLSWRSWWAPLFTSPPLQQGEQGLYLGAWAYLQDHHSEFPAILSRTVCLQIKEANRDISITCTFWLLCREASNLSSQYSQCCMHLTHSNQLLKNYLAIKPTLISFYTKQHERLTKKAGEPPEPSGSEVPVSDIVYVPLP